MKTQEKIAEILGREEGKHYRGRMFVLLDNGTADICLACMGIVQQRRRISLGRSKICNAFKLLAGMEKLWNTASPELKKDVIYARSE